MAISQFPIPAAEDTSVNNLKYNVVAANNSNLYKSTQALKPGIYTISCVSTTNTTVAFWNSSTEILSTTTVSGTISVNLPNGATSFFYSINTGTSISIDIQRVANVVASAVAVVDILTSSGSYTHTGKAYVVAVGGGEGGQSSSVSGVNQTGQAGRGGQSGGIAADLLTLSGTVNYTVGAAGNSNGPGVGAGIPNAGGNSTFSNVVTSANVGNGNGGAAQNTTNGDNGIAGTTSAYQFVVNGTTGGGGGGTRSGPGGANGGNGAGSGIGTGGNGGRPISNSPTSQNNGNNASGFGGGGGGSGANAQGGGHASGGNGGPGVIYVLKLPQ